MSGDEPKWSPDHRQIAFTRADFSRRPTPASEAWLIDADGTNERQLTSIYPDQVRFIAFGGRTPEIAYDDGQGIEVMSPDGSRPRRVLRDGGNADELAIAPSGRMLAYVSNSTASSPARLLVVGLDGTGHRVVFAGTRHTCSVGSPSWSPDGRWIAFTLCIDRGVLDEQVGVWRIRPDGRDLRRVVRDATRPTWSPDGRWIAYVGSRPDPRQGEVSALFAIHPDGTGRARLTPETAGSTATADAPDW